MLRQLGNTDIEITAVAMGCWPIAGMTSLDVNDQDSGATLQSAVDQGINFFDTAYCYGADGQSERLIAANLGHRRRELVIATKGGIHWDANGERQFDARPATLIEQCESSLQRLATDHVDLLYLHAPDPQVPVAESAGAIAQLVSAGKARAAGVSNLSTAEMDAFQAECPISAVQPPYNMLQRQIEDDILPWCQAHNASAIVYWPLMKGLLAGRLPRDHVFQPGDGRAKYPMFSGEEWQKNQDFLDRLRAIAAEAGHTVAQLVVNWTIHQSGVSAALCGAKRATQIVETAEAMRWEMSESTRQQIDAALSERGTAKTRSAV